MRPGTLLDLQVSGNEMSGRQLPHHATLSLVEPPESM